MSSSNSSEAHTVEHLDKPLSYIILGAVIAALFAFDVIRAHRASDRQNASVRNAAVEYAAWTVLGLLVAIPVFFLGSGTEATQYTTAYLLEKTLSVDNVAVFAAIFAGFAVAKPAQPALLQQGIVGALALRIVFIAAGVALIDAVHNVLIVFGVVLVLTGLNMLRHGQDHSPTPPRMPAFLARGGRAPLIAMIVADLVFAVDSIPAAFAVTTETFLVIAANAFAIMGLRPTFVLLAGGLERFRYLGAGVAIVLVLIGVKLAFENQVHVESWVSLVGVFVILGGAILLSLRQERENVAV